MCCTIHSPDIQSHRAHTQVDYNYPQIDIDKIDRQPASQALIDAINNVMCLYSGQLSFIITDPANTSVKQPSSSKRKLRTIIR